MKFKTYGGISDFTFQHFIKDRAMFFANWGILPEEIFGPEWAGATLLSDSYTYYDDVDYHTVTVSYLAHPIFKFPQDSKTLWRSIVNEYLFSSDVIDSWNSVLNEYALAPVEKDCIDFQDTEYRSAIQSIIEQHDLWDHNQLIEYTDSVALKNRGLISVHGEWTAPVLGLAYYQMPNDWGENLMDVMSLI